MKRNDVAVVGEIYVDHVLTGFWIGRNLEKNCLRKSMFAK